MKGCFVFSIDSKKHKKKLISSKRIYKLITLCWKHQIQLRQYRLQTLVLLQVERHTLLPWLYLPRKLVHVVLSDIHIGLTFEFPQLDQPVFSKIPSWFWL
eukprot:GFUD01022887.1.p1 GENE.GFUD01022887.1~~GFUD01022887.1.p1  ORF type:complete len:100 (+),score=11.70 GFUD01022887.1:10-309(+)